MALNHRPRGQNHKERFPPSAITGQRQERVLRTEVGRLQELDQEKLARTSYWKYRPGGFQKPDPTVAKARNRLAAPFYQL